MDAIESWYYSTSQGERIGPISFEEICALVRGGRMYRQDLVWAAHLSEWTPLEHIPELAELTSRIPPDVQTVSSRQAAQDTLDTIKNLELASAIVWSVIAGCQTLIAVLLMLIPFYGPSSAALFLLIAGVWNIFAAVSRFGLIKKIKERRKSVVITYESITHLVIIAIVNLLIGALIGALWVIIDFIIRDKVLKNRHLFDQ